MASDEEDDDDNADKKEDDDMEGEVILKWYILIFESKSNLYNGRILKILCYHDFSFDYSKTIEGTPLPLKPRRSQKRNFKINFHLLKEQHKR